MRKSLCNVVRDIEQRNPNAIIVMKRPKYGMIWCGKAKFVFNTFHREVWESEILSIEVRDRDIAITIP